MKKKVKVSKSDHIFKESTPSHPRPEGGYHGSVCHHGPAKLSKALWSTESKEQFVIGSCVVSNNGHQVPALTSVEQCKTAMQ